MLIYNLAQLLCIKVYKLFLIQESYELDLIIITPILQVGKMKHTKIAYTKTMTIWDSNQDSSAPNSMLFTTVHFPLRGCQTGDPQLVTISDHRTSTKCL